MSDDANGRRNIIVAGHRLSARSARLAGQVSGVWGVQVLAMVAQLGYTALTSRIFSAEVFGYYGIALAISAPLGILAGLGLANAAARRTEEDERGDRAVAGVALVSGASAGLLLLLLAEPLAVLWGAPGSVDFIRLISLVTLIGPYAGALMGVLRRQNRFRAYSLVTLGSSMAGLLLGAVAVSVTRHPLALIVMPLVTQFATASTAGWLAGRRAVPALPTGDTRPDLLFGCRSMSLSLLASASFAVPQWAMSRVLGAVTFGFWNRAVVVGTVPLETVNRAFVTVVYPRFRRHDPSGSPLLWTDTLVTMVVVLVVPAAVLVPLMPAAVTVLMGPGWMVTANMAQWLWVIAALMIPVTVLASALESSNNFSALWAGQIAMAVAFVLGGALVVLIHHWEAVAASFLVGGLMAHVLQIRAAGRRGLLDTPYLLRGYALAGTAAVILVVAGAAVAAAGPPAVVQLILGALIVTAYASVLWRLRGRVASLGRLVLDT